MWFKQIFVYQFNEGFNVTSEQIQTALVQKPWRPCSQQEASSMGFRSVKKHDDSLIYVTGSQTYFKITKQERILPSSVINEALQEKVEEIKNNEQRNVSKKERTEIKDEIIFELLPRAFTKNRDYLGFFCSDSQRLILNCSSASAADDITAMLRDALGSLAVTPWQNVLDIKSKLTSWLDETPVGFELLEDFELTSSSDTQSKLKLKHLPLHSKQIEEYVAEGLLISQLRVNFEEKIEFSIKENATIGRIKYGDELLQSEQSEDEDAQFDADCILHSKEVLNIVAKIEELFQVAPGI
ncbi:recombination-associated protein RdgC [Marinicellulosiphila megalodicopiae]|uniref:recombination-associated protein RdgC n=1 Tax=Marinicellulosiphila megalodicopiae TaxID=2724896 RepID=UPI003BB21F78